MLLPGLPIPVFGMGKDTVEVISPPRWVAASALALDAYEEALPGAVSGQEGMESETDEKCRSGQLLPGGMGQQAGSEASSNVCALQKKNFLGRGLAALRA